MLTTTGCPQCGQPAMITDRFVLESTDGPVEHLRTYCVARHRLMLSTELLVRSAALARAADASALG
jgi:hypothetical protein